MMVRNISIIAYIAIPTLIDSAVGLPQSIHNGLRFQVTAKRKTFLPIDFDPSILRHALF